MKAKSLNSPQANKPYYGYCTGPQSECGRLYTIWIASSDPVFHPAASLISVISKRESLPLTQPLDPLQANQPNGYHTGLQCKFALQDTFKFLDWIHILLWVPDWDVSGNVPIPAIFHLFEGFLHQHLRCWAAECGSTLECPITPHPISPI
ncbi:hypothetical protein PAXRUDRAFT_562171 [Paxillus rubicundulus Ve08.2h10]|uniref:Uncharacterized protein n=1 Tax=Paxillus rubicundulus Ve08.2h10 TaxID=930991 RepID=A0A0D0BRI1_9AGAM|nr:hypothetical protein PAXRUDRAFT_562171 [Paxillus rubicundulus Ve08.2h10]